MTTMQAEILSVLTDEPQTAAEIAAQLKHSTRSVANSLAWMRSSLLVDDGCGFKAVFHDRENIEYPQAPWYNYAHPKWVKMPLSKLNAIRELHKQRATGVAT